MPHRVAAGDVGGRSTEVLSETLFDGPELRAVLELTANEAIKEASELTDAHAVSLPVDELTDDHREARP